MSKNKAIDPFIDPIKQTMKGQEKHHAHWYRGRHRTVMFTERLSVAAASVSSSSDVGWTDVDISAFVSEDAFAVILLVFLSDTASSTTNCFAKFRENGAASDGTGFVYGRHLNGQWQSNQLIVPLDDNKIFEFSVDATGVNTATLATYIVGYVEQIS